MKKSAAVLLVVFLVLRSQLTVAESRWPVDLESVRKEKCESFPKESPSESGPSVEYLQFVHNESCWMERVQKKLKNDPAAFCPGAKPTEYDECFAAMSRAWNTNPGRTPTGYGLHLAAWTSALMNAKSRFASPNAARIELLEILVRDLEIHSEKGTKDLSTFGREPASEADALKQVVNGIEAKHRRAVIQQLTRGISTMKNSSSVSAEERKKLNELEKKAAKYK